MGNKDISKQRLWQRLVRKCRYRSLIMGRPVVKIDHHKIMIVSDGYIRYTGLFLAFAGLVPLVIELLLMLGFGSGRHLPLWPVFLPVGVVLFLIGLALFFRRDTITWPGFGHGIYIRHGFFFYSVVYFLSLENLQASLVLNRRKGFTRLLTIKGDCMLTLTNQENEGVLLVAAANCKEQLLPALNSLAAVIRGCGLEGTLGSYDRTMADFQLEKHRMRIYKGSINRSAMGIRSLTPFEIDSGFTLQRSHFETSLWIILVTIGLVLVPLGWHLTCHAFHQNGFESSFIIIVCLLFALVGGLGIYPGYDIQSVSFDKENTRLCIEYGIIDLKSPRPRKLSVNYNTIAAVQICPVYMDDFFTAYEMNLVMISNQDRRVYLAGYFNLERVRSVARQVADQIGCELLDHTL